MTAEISKNEFPTTEERLPWRAILGLLVLAVIWGTNPAIVKIAANDISPLFMAGIRSVMASICMAIWMRVKKTPYFISGKVMWHWVMIGILFGLEFGSFYLGVTYTLASRACVLVYTAPFFVAIGAHFFLRNDRLTISKVAGLLLAFTGVVLIFFRDFGEFSLKTLPGDIAALSAGAFWGATTVYLKKFLVQKTHPLQTLFYQLTVSAPLLFFLSFIFEDHPITAFSWATALSLLFQCFIVAFFSLLLWLSLVHRYPASLLHGFSYFTPIFGVFLSGIVILGETVTVRFFLALALVIFGMYFVNRGSRKGRVVCDDRI